MITLQVGHVINNKLVVVSEESMINSCKSEMIKKFQGLELKGDESAVLINQEGGVLRRGRVFDLNTVKTITQ